MSELPPPPAPPARVFPIGRLLVGAGLVLAGVGWLLDALDVFDFDWDVVLPVLLILVGVALVVSAQRGEGRAGLIAFGAVLTVVLPLGTLVQIPFGGGVGDATERPTEFRDRSYEHAIGKLTVDLSGLAWDEASGTADATVDAAVGIGQLVVIVPQDIGCVAPHARAGIGEVKVFGESEGGIGPDYEVRTSCTVGPTLRLELSVGLGQVEVRHG
jgi:predicted membrane protein